MELNKEEQVFLRLLMRDGMTVTWETNHKVKEILFYKLKENYQGVNQCKQQLQNKQKLLSQNYPIGSPNGWISYNCELRR